MAVATAASQGWQQTYLGPDLPAEDIAAAVEQTQAMAVALSIVFPGDDPLVKSELRKLRQLIPAGVPIFVGGRAAENYRDVFDEIGAVRVPDMPAFRTILEELRKGANPAQSRGV